MVLPCVLPFREWWRGWWSRYRPSFDVESTLLFPDLRRLDELTVSELGCLRRIIVHAFFVNEIDERRYARLIYLVERTESLYSAVEWSLLEACLFSAQSWSDVRRAYQRWRRQRNGQR